jgi:hypothetical protein
MIRRAHNERRGLIIGLCVASKAPAHPCPEIFAYSVDAYLTGHFRLGSAKKRALAWPGLVWHATKATVRDYGGHMDWPACWNEVLRFSIRQHWIQCLITS